MQTEGGQFVFANGDTTGFGFHGDFLNGWKVDVQEGAVRNCLYTDEGGRIEACSYLVSSYDADVPRHCPEQPTVFDETVHGTLTGLPGCNPLSSGPAAAPQLQCGLGSSSAELMLNMSNLTVPRRGGLL